MSTYLAGYYSKVNFRRFYENITGDAQNSKGSKITIDETIERNEKTGRVVMRRIIYTDTNGHATRKITRENGRLRSDELFGVYEKLYEKGKVVKDINFQAGSLVCKNGLQTDKTDKLFGEKIKCLSWYSKGSLYKQIAWYSNNLKAYQYSKGSKKPLHLRRKTGELWAVYTGAPVSWSPLGCIFNSGSSRYAWQGEGKLKKSPADISGSGNFTIKVYNKNGHVYFTGAYENNQKIGIWLEKGTKTFYLSGVSVSEKLYSGDAETWDADEVLGIENAQLRASLLKKFTYERLIQRKKGVVIDTDKTNDRDNSIIELTNEKGDNDDKIIHILKLRCSTTQTYYALRIPPEIIKCEVARSWTFNKDVDDKNNIPDEELVRFARET